MNTVGVEAARIRTAWRGRISGCMLGKPVELLLFQEGIAGLEMYLRQAQAYPLENYVPLLRFVDSNIVDEHLLRENGVVYAAARTPPHATHCNVEDQVKRLVKWPRFPARPFIDIRKVQRVIHVNIDLFR